MTEFMTELEITYKHLESADCVEDVFGSKEPVNRGYRTLAKIVHPDQNNGSSLSKTAFELLSQLHKEALSRLKEGTYGQKKKVWWKIPINVGKYEVSKFPVSGDICDLYVGKDVVIKVARNCDDNDLLTAEADALRKLAKIVPPVNEGVPRLINTFQVSGRKRRNANVINYMPGFLTLQEAKNKLGTLDPRMLVWLFKRTLTVLGWSHHLGVIHGAVLPQHIMVFPDNAVDGRDSRKHTIRLVDWCYSVGKNRTRLSAIVEGYESYYAPEVLDKKINMCSDVYSAAKVIRSLGAVPDGLEKILDRALDKLPEKRYTDVKSIFDAWMIASEEAYGPPSWSNFNV